MDQDTPTVETLLQSQGRRLDLRWVAGRDGHQHPLGCSAQTLGKALVGHLNLIHPNRLQILSHLELRYLDGLEPAAREEVVRQLFATQPAVVIIAEGLTPPADIKAEAEATRIPLLASPYNSLKLISCLRHYLGGELAVRTTLHGVFMEVNGMGVLISGASGVGKSELALELITRNHRLIADDAPEFSRVGPDTIRGHCPDLLRDFLEVRGLGLLDIRAMYGDNAIKQCKDLGLIVHLERLAAEALNNLDRLEGAYRQRTILDIEVPEVTIPVAPGRNLAVLVEAAARHHILLRKGYNASQEFIQRQRTLLDQNS